MQKSQSKSTVRAFSSLTKALGLSGQDPSLHDSSHAVHRALSQQTEIMLGLMAA